MSTQDQQLVEARVTAEPGGVYAHAIPKMFCSHAIADVTMRCRADAPQPVVNRALCAARDSVQRFFKDTVSGFGFPTALPARSLVEVGDIVYDLSITIRPRGDISVDGMDRDDVTHLLMHAIARFNEALQETQCREKFITKITSMTGGSREYIESRIGRRRTMFRLVFTSMASLAIRRIKARRNRSSSLERDTQR